MPDDAVARISQAVGDLLRLSASERVHAARQAATGISLTRTELRFLGVVDELGPKPVTEVGAVLHLSQPTASRTLRALEDAGFVQRGVDQRDGRVARYEITPAGRQVRRRFEAYMASQLDVALADMPADRREELAQLLEELVARAYAGDRVS